MPKYIEITEDEAWAIDHTIRHTYAEGANVIGRDLLLKVMTLVLEFEERRGKPLAPQVLPLALTEDECWAIDHQIRCDLTVNGKPIGRAILLKVFHALTEFANDRDSEAGVMQLGTLADLLRAPPTRIPPRHWEATIPSHRRPTRTSLTGRQARPTRLTPARTPTTAPPGRCPAGSE